MKRGFNFLFIIGIFIFFLGGCSVLGHYEELSTLKKVGASQADISRNLNKQEKLFYKLKKDVSEDKLKAGVSKTRIIALYGEPILSNLVEGNGNIEEVFLYRHPTEYFASDRIYLYFNYNQELSYFEIK